MKVSSIRLEWRKRSGGGGQTERDFLEFIVDDQPLRETLKTANISTLGWLSHHWNNLAVDRLLLEAVADLPDNRRSLYVCAECGDVDCGAVSVVIERIEELVVWKDFGFQNNYDPEMAEGYEHVGPFYFTATEYDETIRSALTTTNEQ